MAKKSRRGISTAILCLTIAIGGGMGTSAILTEGLFNGTRVSVDGDVQETLRNVVDSIEQESVSDNTLLQDTETFANLPESFGGIEGGYSYRVALGSTVDDYCLMLRQVDGKDAPDGYVYSSASESITVKGENDACPVEDFITVQKNLDSSNVVPKNIEYLLAYALSFTVATLPLIWFSQDNSSPVVASAHSRVAPRMAPARVASSVSKNQLHTKMKAVILAWSNYETDPVKILDYPMVSNMGFAPTANFHLTMLRVKAAFKKDIPLESLEELVIKFEHSYEVMISEAKRMKWNSFSVEEQKHLRSAQQLLNIALDSSSSINERNLAYKKLLKEVEGIISLSPATILAIEEKSLLRIS